MQDTAKQAQVLTVRYEKLSNGVKALEHEIDQMVYQLYGLTPEEIKIVEGE